MKKKYLLSCIFAAALLLPGISAGAQENRSLPAANLELPGLELDTVRIQRAFVVNDYSSFGVEAGVPFNNMLFNPPKSTKFTAYGYQVDIWYTHYSKLFGYMPYFGYQIGLSHTTGGFRFKEVEEKDGTITIPHLDGFKGAEWKVVEAPFLMVFHVDAAHFKIMAKAGLYVGYRYDIHRTIHDRYVDTGARFLGYDVYEYKDKWRDIDRRVDYGLKGGAGIAYVLDPFEFHFNVSFKYGWSSLYQPDYASPYYYRFSYPFDVIFTAGVHYQLTRRSGKTRAQLRREAYDAIYNPTLDTPLQ